ncbi:MAG: TetR family transcriptional regulator [Lachnospiraceae bacterium]|nr:TetR family transcriptional regulator [Lachnospiraceae bacterium]
MEGISGRQESAKEHTKYRLADSIKRCMKTTPVDRITVKDIVEGCGLTRQTFYRNFKDKYDLINWYFDKMVQKSLGKIETGSTVRESLARKLAFILEEKAFFSGAFRSDDHNSLKEHDFELILQFYNRLLAHRISRPLDENLQFQLEMYCRGSVYMTVKWVLGGMRETPWQMSDRLVDAMPPGLAKVFEQLGLLE